MAKGPADPVSQDLGDHHTSQVVNFLLCTLGDLDPRILLQYMLLCCLPAHVQHTLAMSEAENLKKLGGEDKILDFPQTIPRATYSALCSTRLCSVCPLHPLVGWMNTPQMTCWKFTTMDAVLSSWSLLTNPNPFP